jgi:hypothetical protein
MLEIYYDLLCLISTQIIVQWYQHFQLKELLL